MATIQTAFWRMDGGGPVAISSHAIEFEEHLEDMIVAEPDLLGPDRLLVIDRQVLTSHGRRLDLLAIDDQALLHAIELKRDQTPREVVAQALDYGWWIRTLTLADIREIWGASGLERGPDGFDEAFLSQFGTPLEEETFNTEHRLTIVASSLDAATPRIIEYLAEDYGVPINAVLFDYFRDDARAYLSRTWLRPPDDDEARPGPKRPHKGAKPSWNQRDVFMPLGRAADDPRYARWAHGLKHGFVGAGGGAKYWKFLRRLKPGMRVFAYVAGAGYVGIGEVAGELLPLEDLQVQIGGQPVRFVELDDCPPHFLERIADEEPDNREYAVPVRWMAKVPSLDAAVYDSGLRAQQLPCRLMHQRTIDVVEAAFGLTTPTAATPAGQR